MTPNGFREVKRKAQKCKTIGLDSLTSFYLQLPALTNYPSQPPRLEEGELL